MQLSKAATELLAKELNGGVFVNITSVQIGGKIIVSKDYYIVQDGIVYLMNDGRKQPTGDSLLNVKSDCHRVGVYAPMSIYKKKIKEYTIAEYCKLHGI